MTLSKRDRVPRIVAGLVLVQILLLSNGMNLAFVTHKQCMRYANIE